MTARYGNNDTPSPQTSERREVRGGEYMWQNGLTTPPFMPTAMEQVLRDAKVDGTPDQIKEAANGINTLMERMIQNDDPIRDQLKMIRNFVGPMMRDGFSTQEIGSAVTSCYKQFLHQMELRGQVTDYAQHREAGRPVTSAPAATPSAPQPTKTYKPIL